MHYLNVKLLNGFPQILTYQVPAELQGNLVGTVVKVPIQNRLESAYVIEQLVTLPQPVSFTIKPIHSIEQFPADSHHKAFLQQLSWYYQVDSIHFIKRLKHFVEQEAAPLEHSTPAAASDHKDVALTPAQQEIVDTMSPWLQEAAYKPALLHGVTGSGKTEVYKQLIVKTLAQGKSVIVLLPEVSLALRFEQIFKHQLPHDIAIIGFHSSTSAKEKRLLWQRLLHAQPTLIVGVHIPVLLPIARLGLIIIDEEHEQGYQEKKHPKVNSKEAALIRAQVTKIPIVLGSATPSINSLYCVKTRNWHYFSLQDRFAGAFPTIKQVLLTNKERRKNFWITKELENAIAQCLANKEQVILFLNRRGYSFFVQCKECGFIFECSQCSVSLTLHNTELTCHYCATIKPLPTTCSQCNAAQLLKKGIGTQQVVSIIEALFPHARVARADMDVSSNKKQWQATMESFEKGTIDILVGTQTITKGFHFPRVTLVGIIWADLNLHFPVYNAAETCLQQLIQVAGRAGRVALQSTVIVQTMMEHSLFSYANEIDYIKFYHHEHENRTTTLYPPIIRLAEIELKNKNEEMVQKEAQRICNKLLASIETHQWQLTVLGPAKPPVAKIKNTHSRKIYIKGASIHQLIAAYQLIEHKKFKSSIFFTPNP